jgi:hypothetical protein
MSEPVTKTYRGRLNLHGYGEGDDILFLGDDDYPLAEQISEDMEECGRYLSVRYWTSDAEQSDDQLRENVVRSLFGDGEGTRFHNAYSDITGYLWTDEDIMIGGHDLLAELESHLGQWCLLEIGYSALPAPQN